MIVSLGKARNGCNEEDDDDCDDDDGDDGDLRDGIHPKYLRNEYL